MESTGAELSPTQRTPPTGRISSLDGLRGLAAIVVVFHHVMLTSPQTGNSNFGSFRWWLESTPLHLAWAGTEAVLIFFVLSGFVLIGPALGPGYAWRVYFAKRLPRLYLPVWGSLLFVTLLSTLAPRRPIDGASDWLNTHVQPTVADVAQDSLLIFGTSDLNSPLWSLTYEVWFSLTLPIFVVVVIWARRSTARLIVTLAAITASVASSSLTHASARFMPLFLVGGLLFAYRGHLLRMGEHIAKHPLLGWTLAAVAVTAMSAVWMTSAYTSSETIRSLSKAAQLPAAALIVWLAMSWTSFVKFLNRAPLAWLGSRSFSLYLTHEPIVVAVAYATHGRASTLVILAISLPTALLVAEVFFRGVESKSHQLAKRVGTSVAKELSRRKTDCA